MARCENKSCFNQAAVNQRFCAIHYVSGEAGQIAKPKLANPAADVDSDIVPIADIPKNSRYNEAACNVAQALKDLTEGHALKMRLDKIQKKTCVAAQQYASKDHGIKVGIRYAPPYVYMWKLTESEIQVSKAKSDRMLNARAKKNKKPKIAVAS